MPEQDLDSGDEAFSSSHAQSLEDPGAESSLGRIACNGCRKSKLRCSRERPTCSHCRKHGTECVYDTKRAKPGVKAGAIESIYKRLDAIEQALSEKPSLSDGIFNGHGNSGLGNSDADRIVSLLARELPKLTRTSTAGDREDREDRENREDRGDYHATITETRPPKRQRVGSEGNYRSPSSTVDENPPLPHPDMIQSLVDIYFSHIHPWIPMLNQDRFRQRLDDPVEATKLDIVLHAISIAVPKYLPSGPNSPSLFRQGWTPQRVRRWIVSTAMESISIEGLQALIIIAFNDIGSGNASKAWSIIASLSRTVEYCQLTTDNFEEEHQPLCRPYMCLGRAKDWADAEERRRVFWNVFILDRFCSMTMGWNTSLTSIDVQQRLPADGILWRKQEAVLTPYLGVWDKSMVRTGKIETGQLYGPNDVDKSSPEANHHHHHHHHRWGPQNVQFPAAQQADMANVGAFAYCVEATESLSRVTSLFLHQRLNPHDPKEVDSWLARFRELDIRLAHWKLMLPQKWHGPPRPGARMDPNLTLAHVTHNASTILLHQLIAYPPPTWPFRKRLPSAWSAETCCLAGVQISTITRQYLKTTEISLPMSSCFAFCVFAAARMMIIHWHYEPANRLLDAFWDLTQSLKEMANRWAGAEAGDDAPPPLAARYASTLERLYSHCLRDGNYQFPLMDFTCETDHPMESHHHAHYSKVTQLQRSEPSYTPNADMNHGDSQWNNTNHNNERRDSSSERVGYASMNTPGSVDRTIVPVPSGSNESNQYRMDSNAMYTPAGLTDMEALMARPVNEYFINLDRVISFDDGSLFTSNMESGLW